ncbi:MAG: HypC/HybG/HupF family hydrogenase formation chaperone [Nitrospirota bacterium]|nr:HypC/HybG/HupF family hydrogenase formation chaperone [Nitrospirota bacterium]
MCLAVPSKIVSIEDTTAVVDVYGAQRTISLLLIEENVDIGDYVLVHAGFAIQKIQEDYAKESLELIKQWSGFEESQNENDSD